MATNLFQLGNFTLNSGAKSEWKLGCDAITDDDWSCLAEMVCQLVGPFSSVEGVPQGGLKLARCLEPFEGLDGPHLIVDDVFTTGGSMERTRLAWQIRETGGEGIIPVRGVVGVVVFARGECPFWINSIFEMPQCFWINSLTRGQ